MLKAGRLAFRVLSALTAHVSSALPVSLSHCLPPATLFFLLSFYGLSRPTLLLFVSSLVYHHFGRAYIRIFTSRQEVAVRYLSQELRSACWLPSQRIYHLPCQRVCILSLRLRPATLSSLLFFPVSLSRVFLSFFRAPSASRYSPSVQP